jgi:hypothetical protein
VIGDLFIRDQESTLRSQGHESKILVCVQMACGIIAGSGGLHQHHAYAKSDARTNPYT